MIISFDSQMHRPKSERKKKWITQKFVYNLQSWAFVYLVDTLWIEFVCGFFLRILHSIGNLVVEPVTSLRDEFANQTSFIHLHLSLSTFAFEWNSLRFFWLESVSWKVKPYIESPKIQCHWIDLFFFYLYWTLLQWPEQNRKHLLIFRRYI